MAEARKTVTVVFSDVAESTSLGEQLDPEAVRRVPERYFAEAKAALEAHGSSKPRASWRRPRVPVRVMT